MPSNKPGSYLNRKDELIDSSKALRYSYNAEEDALDIINHGSPLIPKKYDRMVVSNNSDHCIENIEFYADNIVEKSRITFINDVSGNLAGTYFSFYSGRDKKHFVVWYQVSGSGTEPTVSGATLIQVSLTNNDVAKVIALATKLALELATNADFYYRLEYCEEHDNFLIVNIQGGDTTATTDNDTNFNFVTEQEGSSELVGIMDIEYTDGEVTSVDGYSKTLR